MSGPREYVCTVCGERITRLREAAKAMKAALERIAFGEAGTETIAMLKDALAKADEAAGL